MNHVIILSAGAGERMKRGKDKLLMEAGGKPIIYYSIMAFHDRGDIETITLVVSQKNKAEIEEIIKKYRFPRGGKIVLGGKTRQESFARGLKAISKKAKEKDVVIVHNGANPLPSQSEIDETIKKTEEGGACITGHYINATVKEINGEHIVKTHDREKLFAAQTPQVAKYGIFVKALENAKKNKLKATDEAMLLEASGQKISYVEADENNFKITSLSDYERLKEILGEPPKDFRIGIGQDSHMFEDPGHNKKSCLTLAGIKIKNEPKLEANSDGDVVLHAIFNAISQALGKMSLGFYADEQCEKGVTDSKKYLEIILKKMEKEGFGINTVGLMIECRTPKIDPLTGKMKKSLSEILDIPTRRIGITATGGENLTAFGAGLGIQCFAIVSLKKS